MKKLLGCFGSLLLLTTPTLTAISCGKTSGKIQEKNDNNKDNNKNIESGFQYENEDELSVQEKEIIKNTGLFSKLIMLSRHENLNFNANEVLSAVFAPKTTWNAFPRVYNVNGKKYDLTEYTDKLTSEYSNLGRLNAAKCFEPFLPSVFIGMYKDKLYTNYVNNIKNDEDSAVFFAKDDAQDFIFPSDKDRNHLAWTNFTGPLSKYIVDNELFSFNNHWIYRGRGQYGRFIKELNNTDKYWILLKNIVLTEDEKAFKIKNDGVYLTKKIEDSFGSLQQSIYSKQVKTNFFAKILSFIPFVQNFNASLTGSIYGLRLLNETFPFTDTDSNQSSVYIIFLALKWLCEWLSSFVNEKWSDKKTEYKSVELKESWNKIKLNLNANGKDFLMALGNENSPRFKVQSLMNNDGTSAFDVLKNFIVNAKASFNYWTEEDIKEFKKYIIKKIDGKNFITIFVPKLPLKEIFSKITEFFERSDNASVDLIKGLGDLMVVCADNQEKFLAISKNVRYENKDFDMLSKLDQNNIATLFGYNGKSGFEKGSVLNELFYLFNDSTNVSNKSINDLLLDSQSPLYQLSSVYSEFIHNSLLQYALDKKYWKIVGKSFKMEGAITGKNSIGAKFKYSVEYNGKGDKKVTKFLDKAAELPDDFDPVMPWKSNKTKVSKDWKAEDYIAYTGLGNGEFKDVNFKYDIQWSNVSDNSDFPYWVITKIDCFRKDSNDQWTQFYPVM